MGVIMKECIGNGKIKCEWRGLCNSCPVFNLRQNELDLDKWPDDGEVVTAKPIEIRSKGNGA